MMLDGILFISIHINGMVITEKMMCCRNKIRTHENYTLSALFDATIIIIISLRVGVLWSEDHFRGSAWKLYHWINESLRNENDECQRLNIYHLYTNIHCAQFCIQSTNIDVMMMQSIGLIRWNDVANESVEPAASAAVAAMALGQKAPHILICMIQVMAENSMCSNFNYTIPPISSLYIWILKLSSNPNR